MLYIGVDGCKEGWFVVILEGMTYLEVDMFPDIFSLWRQYKDARLILIDIPIGLRDSSFNERTCDKEARKLLGPKRGCSIFPVPCRDAIYADGTEASDLNKRLTGRKLSRQVLGIISKIKQVDQLLAGDKSARSRIREIHPEVCFWALAGNKPMAYSKKVKAGFLERLEVLRSVYPHTDLVVTDALKKYSRRELAKDDILDALVAAITASNEMQGLLSIPEIAELDAKGLPMEIVYCPRC